MTGSSRELAEPGGGFVGKTHCVLMVAACPFPARRGTPIRIEKMAEALGRRGQQVHVATYHLGERGTNPFFAIHRIGEVASYTQTAPGPNWRKLLLVDPKLLGTVYRLACELRPEVIHAHHFEGLLVSLPVAVRHRIPLVFDAHVLLAGELDYYEAELGMPSGLRRAMARLLDYLLPRLAHHVISVSDEIKARLHEDYGIPLSSITVIANGVEKIFFGGRSGAFSADGCKRIVFAGNLAKYQGVDMLLESFVEVARLRSDVRLVLVTQSPTDEFAAQARARGVLDRIEFLSDDLIRLPDRLASADVLVNPRTICPGVPQKLLNYMASGTPIVSFEGSTRYIVHGVSGLVVRNGDVQMFAKGILDVLANPDFGRRLGAAARAFAEQSLSWAASAEKVEQVYSNLVARSHE